MPTLFKRSNGIYYSVLTDQSGRRKWQSTGQRTKRLALRTLSSIPQDRSPMPPRRTLHEFRTEFIDYARQMHSPGNVGIYERAFSTFLNIIGDIELSSVNARCVDAFKVKRLAQDISRTTLNIELRSLRAAFNIAVRWEMIACNPFKGVRLCQMDEQTPPFFSIADFKILLDGIPKSWFRDVVVVGALTGMRRGEILNLKWSAVDLDRHVIVIQSSGEFRTKRGKRRVIPMNDSVSAMLQRRAIARDSEYVFTNDGQRISPEGLSLMFKRKVRQLKLNDKLHFHSLRHSFASWLIQSGAASIFEVQKLLGHTNIATTEIYSHLLPENLMESVNRMPIKCEV